MARSSASGRSAATHSSATRTPPFKIQGRNFLRFHDNAVAVWYGSPSGSVVLDHALDDFSFEFWIKTTDTIGTIFAKLAANKGYQLNFPSATPGRIKWLIQDVDAAWVAATTPAATVICDNLWHHIVCVCDRSGTATLKIYVDGVLSNTSASISAIKTITNQTSNIFRLNSTTAAASLACQMSDLLHYSVALTVDEVLQRYNGVYIERGLANWWDMSEIANTLSTEFPGNVILKDKAKVGGAVDIAMVGVPYNREIDHRFSVDTTKLARVGVFSDLHHGYHLTTGEAQNTVANLTTAINTFIDKNCDFIVGLGDTISGKSSATATSAANMITAVGQVVTELDKTTIPIYLIVGNHDEDGGAVATTSFTMTDFYNEINTGAVYLQLTTIGESDYYCYSLDANGIHVVCLDGRDDGYHGTDADHPAQTRTSPLAGAITETDETLTVDDTDNFREHGSVYIGEEMITYTSKDATHLYGCTRGCFGTDAAVHADNAVVQGDRGMMCASQAQLDWLDADLAATSLPVLFLIHPRIDQNYPGEFSGLTTGTTTTYTTNQYAWIGAGPVYATVCANADDIRAILEKHKSKVKWVFNGHEHNSRTGTVNGIKYVSFPDLQTANNYTYVDLYSNGNIEVFGTGATGTGVASYSYSRR